MLSKRSTVRPLVLALLASALCGPLRAAELGEVKVNSYIGQQLSADIELVDLTPVDLAELQARLASPDVFKGAGLEVPPQLGSLHIAVARRDNKRFLHLTTLQPVNADALHLFLELHSGGRQTIRAASLWLTPEPPEQRAARTAAPASPVPAPPAPVPSPQNSAEAGLNEAAQRAFAYRKEQALAQAAAPAEHVAAPALPKAEPLAQAPAEAPPRKQPVKHAAAVAAPPAQSCAPAQQVQAEIQQCQALASKLVDVEGKVQRLQTALKPPALAAAKPEPTPAAKAETTPVQPAAAPTKPASAPAKPSATPVKPGVAADLAGGSRKRLAMIVGGALAGLAAFGLLVYFLRRRQANGPLKIWQSFRKKGATDEEVPVLEEVAELAAQ